MVIPSGGRRPNRHTTRAISAKAKGHIDQAKQWRLVAAKKQAAGKSAAVFAAVVKSIGPQITAAAAMHGGSEKTRSAINVLKRVTKTAVKAAKKSSAAETATREIARTHIGAAKKIAEKDNPLVLRRGRKHRDFL